MEVAGARWIFAALAALVAPPAVGQAPRLFTPRRGWVWKRPCWGVGRSGELFPNHVRRDARAAALRPLALCPSCGWLANEEPRRWGALPRGRKGFGAK